MSRVFARDAALRVAVRRAALGAGAGGAPADGTPRTAACGSPPSCAAQAGLVADMDRVADALYGRAGAASERKSLEQ